MVAKSFQRFYGNKHVDDDSAGIFVKPPPSSMVKSILTLTNSDAILCSVRVAKDGKFFTIPSTHLGNSLVMIAEGQNSRYPAQIQSIFVKSKDGPIYLAVTRLLSLHRGLKDPFSLFTDVEAKAYGIYSSSLEVVALTSIAGHYARWNVTDEICFVVDLTQVRHLTFFVGT